jgi:hypothetical protein
MTVCGLVLNILIARKLPDRKGTSAPAATVGIQLSCHLKRRQLRKNVSVKQG